MELKLQSENPRAINYVEVNEKVYAKLGAREIAFKLETEKKGMNLFVFTEPTIGQTQIIQGGSGSGLQIFRDTFNDMVVIPEKEEFDKIYSDFFNDELVKFGERFALALKEKQKK